MKPKTAAELANLKIWFPRTPAGVGASGDICGKYEYKLVKLPHHIYPNQFRHDQKMRKQRGGSSSGSSSKKSSSAKAPPDTELATYNGVRGGFAQGTPCHARANPEQTPNESEVAGISGEAQGATPVR